MYSLFKSIVNATTTEFRSNLRIIFTGSTLVRAWNELLKCTANDFAPYTIIQLVSISCQCDQVYLEAARQIHRKQDQPAPDEIIARGDNPATISYFIATWTKEQSNKQGKIFSPDERISNAVRLVQEKFKMEFLIDVHPLLKELPSEKRKILFQLTHPTSDDPQSSLGRLYEIFGPFISEFTFNGTPHWEFYPSYLKFFISSYLDKDGD